GRYGEQLRRVVAQYVSVPGPAILDREVASLDPSQLPQAAFERGDARLCLRVVGGKTHQHADPPHPLRLLRACGNRPRGCPAEKGDERASFHSITSRVTTYEKCLQHAAFLGVDLVWAIEAVIASQPFHRRRRREHAVGLTGRLEARGDVDGIAPDVVGGPAR